MGTCPPTINQAPQLPTLDFETCTHMACPTDTFSGIVTSTCLRRMPRDPPKKHHRPYDQPLVFDGLFVFGRWFGIGGNTALGSHVFFLAFWAMFLV